VLSVPNPQIHVQRTVVPAPNRMPFVFLSECHIIGHDVNIMRRDSRMIDCAFSYTTVSLWPERSIQIMRRYFRDFFIFELPDFNQR
jgi:hypothetical protein